MKKVFILLTVVNLSFVACKKDGCTDSTATNYDEKADKDDGSCTYKNLTDTNSSGNTNNGGTTDTTSNGNSTDTSSTTTSTKPSSTTFKFASTGKECGLTDGYSNQQHSLPELVHLNTDKCNGETYRPTITLHFETGKTILAGTYLVTKETSPSAGQVHIYASAYNYTNWTCNSGSVVVTLNSDDNSKVDIEFNSVVMDNDNPSDTLNPSTDVLTGHIIKI